MRAFLTLYSVIDAFKCVRTGELLLLDTGHAGEIVNVNNSHLYRRLDLSLYVRSVSCGKEHVLLLTRTGAVVSYGIGGCVYHVRYQHTVI